MSLPVVFRLLPRASRSEVPGEAGQSDPGVCAWSADWEMAVGVPRELSGVLQGLNIGDSTSNWSLQGAVEVIR